MAQRARRRDDRGAAAVEFALISIPLLLIVAGIVQIGAAYSRQLTYTQAARAAARAAAVCGSTCSITPTNQALSTIPNGYQDTGFTIVIQNCSSGGSCTGSSGSPAYCPSGATQSTSYEVATVSDSYTFTFGILKNFSPFTITLTGKATMPCGG